MKKLVLIAAMLMVFGVMTVAQATTFELREYFETLSLPFPKQSASNMWTFHIADHNGVFIPPHPYAPYYSDENGSSGTGIGGFIVAGDWGWGDLGVDSIPTFNGLGIGTGYLPTNPTAVIFHATESVSISEIKLWTEMLSWGIADVGIIVKVNSVISGVTKEIIGLYPVSGSSMFETIYTPSSMILQKGDMIEILYGNTYKNHDHVNANVFISANPVPEPTTMLLLGLGLTGLAGVRRKLRK